MPTPVGLKPEIRDNHDGSINVTYHPTVQGRHEVQMCYEGCSIDGKHQHKAVDLKVCYNVTPHL